MMTHVNRYDSGKRKSSQQCMEVAVAIGRKSVKTAGEDEIRPGLLKAWNSEGILWLNRVCQVAWKFGKTSKE